jgi:hypothetical protein
MKVIIEILRVTKVSQLDNKYFSKQTGESDWIKGLGLALDVAAVAVGGYYVYKKLTEEDEAKTRVACSTSRLTPESAVRWVQNFLEKDSFVMVMTVDAAPGKCAGILRLPRHSKLYYYSFNWVQMFKFSKQHEPDKFEMLNVLVATLAFEHYIRAYQSSYDRILLQEWNSILFMLSIRIAYAMLSNEFA